MGASGGPCPDRCFQPHKLTNKSDRLHQFFSSQINLAIIGADFNIYINLQGVSRKCRTYSSITFRATPPDPRGGKGIFCEWGPAEEKVRKAGLFEGGKGHVCVASHSMTA